MEYENNINSDIGTQFSIKILHYKRRVNSMKALQSDFIVKGYKDTNEFYIVQSNNNKERFFVYQMMGETNSNMEVKTIKNIIPVLKDYSDEEIIVTFPAEEYPSFLFMPNIDIYEMNKFRIYLDKEEIIK